MASINSLTIWLTHAICLCGVIPLFPWIGMAPRSALVVGLLASLWQQRYGQWPLKNWMLNSGIIPVFAWYVLQYRTGNAILPVVNALAFMLAIRLVSEKSVRHYLQIHTLALFCLAASSLFDLSPAFLFYLTILLLLEAPTLVLLTCLASDRDMLLPRKDLRRVLFAGVVLPLASLPLLLLFFPILPRTQMPMWNLMGAPVSRTTGFSEKVEPGVSSNQATVRERVFRAEMPRIAPNQLYWRVSVFNRFDGVNWQRNSMIPSETVSRARPDIEQTIFLEPVSMRYLPFLDEPISMDGTNANRSADGVYERSRGLGKRVSYHAVSDNSGIIKVKNGLKTALYLQLPQTVAPRITALAERFRRQGTSAGQRVELLEAYFRNGGYRYSMQGMPTGEHALERFLFERKQGNCEFFASAFALILRSAGVPARLVGGYLGGEYNDLGGYYLVGEESAHVWVEALVDGNRWQRIDPSSFAANAGEVWGGKKRPDVLARLRLTMDAFDYYWNRAVVTYDFEQQYQAAQSVVRHLRWDGLKPVLMRGRPYLAAVIVLVLAVYLRLRRPGMFAMPEQRLLRRYYRVLEQDCGVRIEPGKLGVFELAELAGNDRARQFAAIYGGAIYRERRLTGDEIRQLKDLLRAGFRQQGEASGG